MLLLIIIVSCQTIPSEWKNLAINQNSKIKILNSRTAGDNFSFVVFGDSREGKDVLDKIIEKINQLNPPPLFVVHLGDMVLNGKKDEYQQFLSQINRLSVPIIGVAGNHDLRGEGSSYFRKIFGPDNFYFDYSNYRFIFLNNALFKLTANQLWWLQELLSETQKTKFLFLHVPPNLVQVKSSFKDVNFLRLIKGKVKYLFAGHVHYYQKFENDGVTYIISGGGGAKLGYSSLTLGDYIHHFILVEIKNGKILDKLIEIK